MANRTPRQFIDQLNRMPGSLANRSGGENLPASPKDIFRQKMDSASAENQSRLERERSLLARKIEEIRNATHAVNSPVPENAPGNEGTEREEA